MIIYQLSTGEEVHRYQKSIVIHFNGKRKVLSTAYDNGGYSESLKTVFNHDGTKGVGIASKMRGANLEEHMQIIAEEIGLDPKTTAGIATAASMENVSIKTVQYGELTVTAIVTGGIEVNGGRVGDPAYWHEVAGKNQEIKLGTINIILIIDGNLFPSTMTRALVTCTEAKTAAIQELMLGSMYSRGLATGSGTDSTIVVSNAESESVYRQAGKHSKLGELIGVAVKSAVKEALYLQTGAGPVSQFSILRRMQRFGVDCEKIWSIFKEKNDWTKAAFVCQLETLDKKPKLVVLVSLYVHLMDQLDWDLICMEDAACEGSQILKRMNPDAKDATSSELAARTKDELIETMSQKMAENLSELIEVQKCFE